MLKEKDTDTAKPTVKVVRLICHKFQSTVSKETIQALIEGEKEMQEKIPQIQFTAFGTVIQDPMDKGKEDKDKLNKGFTHVVLKGFARAEDLVAYQRARAFDEFVARFFGKDKPPIAADTWEIDIPVRPGMHLDADNLPVVLRILGFKYQEEGDKQTRSRIAQLVSMLKGLFGKIRQIKLFFGGAPIAKTPFDKNFTHAFVEGFNTEKALRIYAGSKPHLAFVDALLKQPLVFDDSLVIDVALTK